MRDDNNCSVFESEAFADHEQVVFCADAASGLKAIIAIHDTTLGPALGGTRMWNYETEQQALEDVLRLSHGMTYKNALAGLPLGGGKAVIIGDPKTDKSPAALRALGRMIDRLGGYFITGEDVGISVSDAEEMRKETPHVRGIVEGKVGDPSPHTAWGVMKGIEAALYHVTGSFRLKGRTVCVQGLGHVGMALAGHLHDAGAELIVTDIEESNIIEAMDRFGASIIDPDKAHSVEADVFAPCALGAGLNARTIPEIRATIVAGAANNQLDTPADGKRLSDHGILYAPDYVINAGGVLAISNEGDNYDVSELRRDLTRIGDTLTRIFNRAKRENRPTSEIADRMAEEIIAGARRPSQAA